MSKATACRTIEIAGTRMREIVTLSEHHAVVVEIPELFSKPASDWDLVVAVCAYSNEPLGITRGLQAELFKGCYSKNDAYGAKGHVPCQGYDWSGIRDSSAEAIKEMADYLREEFTQRGIKVYGYTRRETRFYPVEA